ncbi:Crp/Fnr family transcriptional regulator [Listeria booriae]|uniref:Crp/Fnr family transcriptional regulator n=1 Tax=Listeria booriae TaxID=1552123 RepID=UPI001627BC77|nr:Crp/Fnr family transcriptional regulator [Listeria booriae]MBC2324167.1 Crp/Fnr family transcriptional regulator [Listeria booriae]MCD2208028.1 Crp/Fnr family transcriptional regulator [Listeria booriae]
MSYMELFDKDIISQKFGNKPLLGLLLDDTYYEIDKKQLFFKKNDTLFHEDEAHEYIYIIESGLCEGSRQGHITQFSGKDEIVGMENMLENEVSSLTVKALEKTAVWRFSKSQVMSKLMYTQEGFLFLYQHMRTFNNDLLQKEALLLEDTKSRFLFVLSQLGKIYGEESQDQIILPKIFTKKIIGNYLGITASHASYLCRQLESEGMLETNMNQIVVNKEVAMNLDIFA